MQINSGQDPKIRVYPGMHALTPDECDVYSNLVERSDSGRAAVLHNHCMSEQVRFFCLLYTYGMCTSSGMVLWLRLIKLIMTDYTWHVQQSSF